ncbi:MAG: 5'-methylthioadenosine/adenosylhomocysteine nucleosidase, partial [Eggerthellaceae bacterium]|nr:5'-methylthioadenosine/adenosylhomocysteine nucleosidase [Eggerthellaceae bacterium]
MRYGIIGAMDVELNILVKHLKHSVMISDEVGDDLVEDLEEDLSQTYQPDQLLPKGDGRLAYSKTKYAGRTFYAGTVGKNEVIVVKSGVGMVNAASCAQVLTDKYDVDAIINTGVAGAVGSDLRIGDFVVANDAINAAMDVTNLGYRLGQTPGMSVRFPTDHRLSDGLKKAISQSDPDSKVYSGIIASGDQFVHTVDKKEELRKKFDALCCEMEGAAIA